MATVKVRLDAGEQIVTASIPKEAAEELGLTLPGGGNDQAETLLLALPDVADGVGHLLVASMPVLRQAATRDGRYWRQLLPRRQMWEPWNASPDPHPLRRFRGEHARVAIGPRAAVTHAVEAIATLFLVFTVGAAVARRSLLAPLAVGAALGFNITDFHTEIQRLAFEPNNQVPGTGLSPDKMLLARGSSNADAPGYTPNADLRARSACSVRCSGMPSPNIAAPNAASGWPSLLNVKTHVRQSIWPPYKHASISITTSTVIDTGLRSAGGMFRGGGEFKMADSRLALLKILARIRPETWELIGGGPQGDLYGPFPQPWKWGRGPNPDPWRRDPVDWRVQSQFAAVHLTRRLVDGASLTQAQGGDGPGFLRSIMDDDGWGIEGRPIVGIGLPSDWWKWLEPEPPPRPNELDFLAILGAAGLSFASLSERIGHGGLRDAVAEAGLRVHDLATDYLVQQT